MSMGTMAEVELARFFLNLRRSRGGVQRVIIAEQVDFSRAREIANTLLRIELSHARQFDLNKVTEILVALDLTEDEKEKILPLLVRVYPKTQPSQIAEFLSLQPQKRPVDPVPVRLPSGRERVSLGGHRI